MRSLAYALPGLGRGRTFANWKVWRDSTRRPVKFRAVDKNWAVRLFHQARAFERATRAKGKQDGKLGRNGILVLHALIFDFLNHKTGRLDPSYASIARKAAVSIRSVARGLASLRRAGIVNWVRRCFETVDTNGRFQLEQDTNAYAILAVAHWRGFQSRGDLVPLPDHWGAPEPVAPLADAARDWAGSPLAAIAILRAQGDQDDPVAAALARLGQAITEMPD